MSDYEVGMIQFENNKRGIVLGMIDEMEKDRLSGWHAFFKADYENEKLKKTNKELLSENKRLSKLVEELLCLKECQRSTKKSKKSVKNLRRRMKS